MKKELLGEDGEILIFNRQTARDLVFKQVFQYDYTGEMIAVELDDFAFSKDDLEYITAAIAGMAENMVDVDAKITENAKGYRLERLTKVCLAAMRVAVYEICFMDDIPVGASINEAVEIIKFYDDPKSAAYANGVLGTIAKQS